MKTFAIVLAGGRSERFGSDKSWVEFRGRPLWAASFESFLNSPDIAGVGLVCPAGKEAEFRRFAPGAQFIVSGGTNRQESSRRGVELVPSAYDAVLVHDAARPCVSNALIRSVVEGVERTGAAFPALAVTDTVKVGSGSAWTTLDRSRLVAVQTPQGARRDWLLSAHAQGLQGATDDASLLESLGYPVEAVPGDHANIKITHVGDLSRILGPVETRTGLGYDVHAFSRDPDRPLWLGGVEFQDRPGLEGHSDADALLHAVVDAMLGAAGLGDIGVRYPNTDPRWKDAASSLFLAQTAQLVRESGWEVTNVDATVVAERPKLMPRREEICHRIGELIGIDPGRISIKATTNEGLGAIGRSEGIAAFAVATLTRRIEGRATDLKASRPDFAV